MLKTISANMTKQLKKRQKTHVTTLPTKPAKATMKQIVTQELQVEKSQMREWKQNVILEVTSELQVIKHSQKEMIKARREGFQIELEQIREKLPMVETQLIRLEQ